MAKVAKIIALPIQKSGRGDIMDALSEKGITKWGTSGQRLPPLKLRNNTHATGLDENSDYLKQMLFQAGGDPVKIEQVRAEALKIRERRLRLERALGISLLPDAPYYKGAYNADPGDIRFAQRYKLKATNSFNFDNPIEEVTFWWLCEYGPHNNKNIIAPSLQHWKSGKASGCSFYVENPEEEAKVLYHQAMSEAEAYMTIKDMDERRIKKVAQLCGIPISATDGYQYTFAKLVELIKSTSIDHGEFKGQNGISLFTRIADLDDRTLNAQMLVKDALNHRILTERNGVIYDNDKIVANTKEALVTDLCLESNEQRYLALEIRVNDKRKMVSHIQNFDYSNMPDVLPAGPDLQPVLEPVVVEQQTVTVTTAPDVLAQAEQQLESITKKNEGRKTRSDK